MKKMMFALTCTLLTSASAFSNVSYYYCQSYIGTDRGLLRFCSDIKVTLAGQQAEQRKTCRNWMQEINDQLGLNPRSADIISSNSENDINNKRETSSTKCDVVN